MSLWRLELLRLLRTHRWAILLGVYGVFGVLGPVTAAYLDEILARFGGGVTVTTPEPGPVDGIAQFLGNASQLGLLAVVIVGAGALAVDVRPEVAAFLRTRVERSRTLLWPRYVVAVGAAFVALAVGTGLAWALTGALLGPLPTGPMIIGTLLGGVYLAFALAVLAAVAGFARSQATAVLATLVVLLTLPMVGLVAPVGPWLPSELLAAVGELVAGAPTSAFARSTAMSAVSIAGLLAVAAARSERREI